MGGGRNIALGVGGFTALVALLLALFVRADDAAATAQAARGGIYVGVASCGGTTCHGRSIADGPVVRQDEILIWQDRASAAGAHSRAFAVLQEPRSRQIARRLGIGEAASAPMCLGCHATPAPVGHTGPRFLRSDGVGCESCHGPASGWLASHYSVGGAHRSNVQRGLVPLENPRARASACLDCHFGSQAQGQFVTHRIMAAGHPRISFELDLFSTLQAHHDEDRDYLARKGRTGNVQMWAIGQAMALERSLALFASARGREGIFPEFYFLDCHSCHRPISDNPQFNPTVVDNPARGLPSGYPPYNDENMIMLAAAARVVAPRQGARFEAASRAFHQSMGRDRATMLAAAARLRREADALADAFAGAAISRAQVFRIIDTITAGAISERFTDYAGSVQAVMATDTLLSALVSANEVSADAVQGIRADINLAYQAVREPNSYNPRTFRASLGRAAAAIRRLR